MLSLKTYAASYLFLFRSKPSTHLSALGRLGDEKIRENTPEVLMALVEHIRRRVSL
ncbi:hypothetical protein ABTZ59_35720 [Streptomyces sp. NPDC094034]|uniref:hypothetical protein n=1 Tax=Streptomyces sp. NPDC094034 TaxID=3155309 RepID=UPI00331BD4BE